MASHLNSSLPFALPLPKERISVLAKKNKVIIIRNPYPILIIKDAIDEDVYSQLEKEYPSLEKIFELDNNMSKIRNNSRYQIGADIGMKNPDISPLWRQFIKYHSSPEFYQEVIELLGNDIRRLHPHIEVECGKKLEDLSVGIRWNNENKEDMVLDCQVGLNSPVTKQTSVKGPHIDNKVELYAGLFYMRDKNDKSRGGMLDIYKHPTGLYKPKKHPDWGKNCILDSSLIKLNSIPYSRNLFVMFINSWKSIHGVSPRQVTNHCRRLVNIIGEAYNLRKKMW